MKYLSASIVLCAFAFAIQAQNTFKAMIKGGEEKLPLAGATCTWKEQKKSVVADSTGLIIFSGLPPGKHTFVISHVGFEAKTVTYTFPPALGVVIDIELEETAEHEEEVVVTATRTSRTISNTPTRTEVISGEELEEKANMKPGDIRMMLSESTGIQTQQISATSYNSSIRIQGLDGRYTQILRDGYPLYGGFSAGLSIMQIAPLDLRQVEVIKGSSSTLYGGGAIAGLVNLVSKTPADKKEFSFVANATSAKGLDISGFYRQKFDKVGLTVFASRNTASAYDPGDIGFTAIPQFERYTINPRLFLYGKNTTANVGFNYITEERIGGSMSYIKNGTSGYFEKNNTGRLTTQFAITHHLNERSILNFKNSYTRFDRRIGIESYSFNGLQQSTFSELTYIIEHEKAQWIAGANFLTDDFREKIVSGQRRDYHLNTYGVFVQNEWSPTTALTLESGLRGDYVNDYGFEFLPRVSALVRISSKLTSRIGVGFGYKTPTIFTEDAERIQFVGILPLNKNTVVNERSLGGNFDVNYRTNFGPVGFSLNHLFFYTRLIKNLVLAQTGSEFEFVNSAGHIDTKGIETNLKFTYGHFKLFVGYTYADVTNYIGNMKSLFPLTAKHRLNNVLMFEVEEKLKIGLEAYYVSRQKLNDGTFGKPYWITGFMVEKLWEKFSLYINFENFTDTRQTRFDTIYTGTVDNPVFRDIYAPVDGFVINGGFKIKL